MNAADIMSTPVISVSPATTVQAIAVLLLEKNISGVPVVDEAGILLGVITEGDLVMRNARLHYPTYIQWLDGVIALPRDRHFIQEVDKMLATTARELMTAKVRTVTEETAVEDVAALMVEKQFGFIPVVRDRAVAGIITRRDIVRLMVRESQASTPDAAENPPA